MITSFNLGGNGGDTYTKQEIDTKVEGLESEISNKVDIETLSDYYTKEETYNKEEVDALIPEVPIATSQLFDDSLIWSGTQEEYDALSEEEKHLYKIYTIEGATNIVTSVNGMTGDVTLEIPEGGDEIIIEYNKYTREYPTAAELLAQLDEIYLSGKINKCVIALTNDWGVYKRYLKYSDGYKNDSMEVPNDYTFCCPNSYNNIVYFNIYRENQTVMIKEDVYLATISELQDKASKYDVYTKGETYNKQEVDALISPKTPNVVKFGELEIEDGVMSNFSSTNYAQFPFLMDLTDKAFEINMEITTSGNVTSQQNILDSQDGLAFAVRNSKFVLAVSNNGSSWAFEAEGGVVESNTTYLIKLSWNRLVYKVLYSTDNGSNWNEAISQAYSGHPYPRTMIIGKDTTNSYIYSGVINLNKCTLAVNNQYVWDGMTDAGLLTRLATDLSNIDNNGVDKIKNIAKEANIVWYGTEEEYNTLPDKSLYQIYLIQ